MELTEENIEQTERLDDDFSENLYILSNGDIVIMDYDGENKKYLTEAQATKLVEVLSSVLVRRHP